MVLLLLFLAEPECYTTCDNEICYWWSGCGSTGSLATQDEDQQLCGMEVARHCLCSREQDRTVDRQRVNRRVLSSLLFPFLKGCREACQSVLLLWSFRPVLIVSEWIHPALTCELVDTWRVLPVPHAYTCIFRPSEISVRDMELLQPVCTLANWHSVGWARVYALNPALKLCW